MLSALEAAVEVGRGGFGGVYAVELPSLPGWGRVAVKRALSGVDAREVMAEVSSLRRCAHRDVLPLLGYCGAPRAACIVTALMRGGSLDDHLLLSPDARARLQPHIQGRGAEKRTRLVATLKHPPPPGPAGPLPRWHCSSSASRRSPFRSRRIPRLAPQMVHIPDAGMV